MTGDLTSGMLLAAGSELGPFRIVSELGEGAMGEVFLAEHMTTGERVALKVLKREFSQDEVYRKRFVREARALGAVHHPHLVRIHDVGEAAGWQYIALSFVDGGSLEGRLQSGPLTLDEILRLAAEVGSALDALHDAGIIHRDIKPSNVLLDSRGSAAVTDFGLAKGRDYTVLTRLGQVMGTLDYLAPELIKGEPATAATDTYALGCVLFECVAGQPPFAGKGMFQVGIAHLNDTPQDPASDRSDIPAAVSAAVLEALAKDPAARPPSTGAYAARIRAASGLPAQS